MGTDWACTLFSREPVLCSEKQLLGRYKHLVYATDDEKEPTKPFIVAFVRDPNIRFRDRVGIFPGAMRVPREAFNLWVPFAVAEADVSMEAEDEDRVNDLAMCLHRVGVLCNHKPAEVCFLLYWLAQAFQYPENKSCMVVIISRQGAGKGEFLQLLKTMMGRAKVLTTTTPQEHVWGKFNHRMGSAFLVHLDELDDSAFEHATGRVKALITDPTLTIEKKFVDAYEIDSYHRFILSTNDVNPVPSTDDERRYFVVRSSDELCEGHEEHHAAFHKLARDVTRLRDFYDYLMKMQVKRQLTKADIPIGAHQQLVHESNRDDVERFVISLADDESVDRLMLTPTELYAKFVAFCASESITSVPTRHAFTTKLGQKKLAGVTNSKPVYDAVAKKEVRKWTFDLVSIRAARPSASAADEDEDESFEPESYEDAARSFLLGEYDEEEGTLQENELGHAAAS